MYFEQTGWFLACTVVFQGAQHIRDENKKHTQLLECLDFLVLASQWVRGCKKSRTFFEDLHQPPPKYWSKFASFIYYVEHSSAVRLVAVHVARRTLKRCAGSPYWALMSCTFYGVIRSWNVKMYLSALYFVLRVWNSVSRTYFRREIQWRVVPRHILNLEVSFWPLQGPEGPKLKVNPRDHVVH